MRIDILFDDRHRNRLPYSRIHMNSDSMLPASAPQIPDQYEEKAISLSKSVEKLVFIYQEKSFRTNLYLDLVVLIDRNNRKKSQTRKVVNANHHGKVQ